MTDWYYDLHLHSCLSPCGDNDATPDSIAGMGELNGLDLMALTDHNTLKNCPAFFAAAERHGIVPVAGAEVTTAEDIHAVCLFETLAGAMAFDEVLDARRVHLPNRPAIFGEQRIVDGEDALIGIEPDLLINATTVPLDELPALVEPYGGVCFPAHVDREANGIFAVLGAFPESPRFGFAEVHDGARLAEFSEKTGLPASRLLHSSDAHVLWDVQERVARLSLACDSRDPERLRAALFAYLRQPL